MLAEWLLAMHMLGAVLWVGALIVALFVLRPRQTAVALPDRTRARLGLFRRFFLVVWHAMPIVLLTGYGLLFGVYGGFAGVRWNVHLMHLLGLVMGAVLVWNSFGPWSAFRGGDNNAIVQVRLLILLNVVLGVVTIFVATLNG